ncbi:tetratricopeptide repeat protein [Clostridium cochlearium]|uniref:tetratricopeptide repeat protein n=1 Tax=Clostridium cochlearium TaxID=1494 RepID=UPI00241D9A80|nr:tetratricopeptide repeat protein [Clostridium cochlearium]MBE6064820.1 hypothetical protein [Clostridium cochlearium]
MGNFLDLFKLILECFPRNIGINVFTVLVAGTIVWKIKILKHPRYLMRYITFVLFSLLILNLKLFKLLETRDLAIIIILIIFYAIVAYLAAQKPIGLSKIKLKKLEEVIEQGLIWDIDKLFLKKPFYIIDLVEKYRYKLLKADYLIVIEDFRGAYEIYNSIDEKRLFKNERLQLFRKKAYTLYRLGDMTKSKNILNIIEDNNEPNYLMLKAMICENSLDLDGASEYLQKALNSINKSNDGILEAIIYNNYGRLRRMEGNLLDAINYYRLSANIAKKHKNKLIIHISFQNLINTCLLKGQIDNVEKYLKEYETLIDTNILNDAIEIYNLKVQMARQYLDKNAVMKVIINGYNDISDRVKNKRRLIFDINVLRMIFNAGMNFDFVMDQIYLNLDEYFTLEMPDRYFLLKEVEIPLKEINFPYCHKYALIHKKIVKYMKTEALADIENYISNLKDYEIIKRCSMEKERVRILTQYIKPYNFEAIYNYMTDVKDIYRKNNMLIDMILMDLDIADECFSPQNYEGEKIKPLPFKKMKEHVEYAEKSLSSLKRYPVIDECNIRLAIYFFKLGDENKSKIYLERFENGSTTIENYAFWIQNGYQYLKYKLG